jgi:ethanolamine ammonia-lyase large subunit
MHNRFNKIFRFKEMKDVVAKTAKIKLLQIS